MKFNKPNQTGMAKKDVNWVHKPGVPGQKHNAVSGSKSPQTANLKKRLVTRNYKSPKGKSY